ncbi:MAG: hypothetical protein HY261_07795 [Chloroflexi bacterium]|nr:hypothetical protein [Chloroflexota bacterium]
MIGVSDTTPVRHLIAIGEAELLPKLYGTVVVPRAVWAELQAEATPAAIKDWLAAPPGWIEVRSPRGVLANAPGLDALDAGEREAIGVEYAVDKGRQWKPFRSSSIPSY